MDETSEVDIDQEVMENKLKDVKEQAKEEESKGKEKNEDKKEKKIKLVRGEVRTREKFRT